MEEVLAESENLALSKLTVWDLSPLYELESDPWIKQYVGGAVRESRDKWLARAACLVNSDSRFKLSCRATAAFAGRLAFGDLGHEPGTVEVQVLLGKAFVGKRLGAEACALACQWAFRSMNATRVGAVVDPLHTASLDLVRRLGFHEIDPQRDPKGALSKRVFVINRIPEHHGDGA